MAFCREHEHLLCIKHSCPSGVLTKSVGSCNAIFKGFSKSVTFGKQFLGYIDRKKRMTDRVVHRQVLALGMPMAVAMCLLETDVTRAFTDAGTPVIPFKCV